MTSDEFQESRSGQLCHPGFTTEQQEHGYFLPYPSQLRGLSPHITTRKTASSSSKVNATWRQGQTKIRPNDKLLKKDLLGLSLHSAKDALSHHENNQVKPASSRSLPPKRSSFKDDPEVTNLLKLLQTTDFVGEIDPIHHSRYIAEPREEESKLTKTTRS
jgi:hypothetical protein